ncbi:MAG: DUF1987 domain-containing protein [Bacteroidales bacterium]
MDEKTIISHLNNETMRDSSNVEIPPTKSTPKVVMDLKQGEFHFEGRSYPSNAKNFYYPVINKINTYLKNPAKTTKLSFFLEYLDSSSTQLILTTINKFAELKTMGYELEIEWKYMEDDDDIKDVGKSFSESSEIPFIFIEVYG